MAKKKAIKKTKQLNAKKAVAKGKPSPSRKTSPRVSAKKTSRSASDVGAKTNKAPAVPMTAKRPAVAHRIETARSTTDTPPASTPQSRPPMRKIIGADRKIISLPMPNSAEGSAAPATAVSETSSHAPTLTAPSPEVSAPPVVLQTTQSALEPEKRIAWSDLPASFPSGTRFLMTAIREEAVKAASWPFPYAKFISTLPQELCGIKFALLLLSLDFDPQETAARTRLPLNEVELLLVSARAQLEESFSSNCGSMARRFRTQVGKAKLEIDSLVEQFLVAKVDRDLQSLLATLLLHVMGACAGEQHVERAAQAHAG